MSWKKSFRPVYAAGTSERAAIELAWLQLVPQLTPAANEIAVTENRPRLIWASATPRVPEFLPAIPRLPQCAVWPMKATMSPVGKGGCQIGTLESQAIARDLS